MSAPEIKLEYLPPVARIILNRPKARNAVSPGMITEIKEALSEIRGRKNLAGVVLTGTGAAFSAGLDLREVKASSEGGAGDSFEDSERFMQLLLDIYSFPKPVLAAVNGTALGGGCGLATVCDIVIASEQASFGYPEVRIGFIPALVSVFLTRIIGEKRAREMMLTGRTISASEGEMFGLVNRVVADSELIATAEMMVHSIARNSPDAVALTKEHLLETDGLGLQEALRLAAAKNALSRYYPDFREGISAFLEKRKPDFKQE